MKRIVVIFFVLILGCNDTTDDLGNNENNGNQDLPTGVQLIFPHEDSLCNEGENPTPEESTIYFEWESNDNAESYTLNIENLSSGNIMQFETEDFIFPVTLQRAESYRWFVSYHYQGESKESAIWNFYNAGPGVQTYPPFPAEIIAPSIGQNIPNTTSVSLQWNGSDVDGDIVGYDVYFGATNPPALNSFDVSSNSLTVSVSSNTIYYWNIITKDAAGNSSESGIHQFRILE